MGKEKYEQIRAYLDSFINYEKKEWFSYKKSLKLERVETLLKKLNVPYGELKVIHIAGTKGKGSTVTFIAYILACSGYKVGIYTSPHFFDFRERIKVVSRENSVVRSQMISKKEVVRIVEEFKPYLEKMRFTKEWGKLSFFEVYTAIAFEYFGRQNLDFVVLETGLGGRLDATNVIKNPLMVCITHIGYDHTDKLGKRLVDIAYEKSMIVKEKVPVVCSFQRSSVEKVIRRRCREVGAEVYFLGKEFSFSNVRFRRDYTFFDFSFQSFHLRNLRIQLKGPHQVENASLAILGVHLLEREKVLPKKKVNFYEGLKQAFIEGRFEICPIRRVPFSKEKEETQIIGKKVVWAESSWGEKRISFFPSQQVNLLKSRKVNFSLKEESVTTSGYTRGPLIVLDIAHNPSSFAALSESLKIYFPKRKVVLIFASSKGKDVKKELKKIDFYKIILTSFANPRSLLPEEIKNLCNLKNAILCPTVKEALELVFKFYNNKSFLTLITGSLYLVAEAKIFLRKCLN